MTPKHDYAAALEAFEIFNDDTRSKEIRMNAVSFHASTILHALKLAEKVTGEPSAGMIDSAKHLHPIGAWIVGKIFKAMIEQAEKEIEQ